MLDHVKAAGLDDVISWASHGRCFSIHNPDRFVDDVLPRYDFRQSKLTSFQRQLNLYGFMRLSAGPDRGAYYHEFLLRGRPEMSKFMLRVRVKTNGIRHSTPSPNSNEPNFYQMPPCDEPEVGPRTNDEKDFPPMVETKFPHTHCGSDKEVKQAIELLEPHHIFPPYPVKSTNTIHASTTHSPSTTQGCPVESVRHCLSDQSLLLLVSPLACPPVLVNSMATTQNSANFSQRYLKPIKDTKTTSESPKICFFEGLQFTPVDLESPLSNQEAYSELWEMDAFDDTPIEVIW
jgi:hypothetical protein